MHKERLFNPGTWAISRSMQASGWRAPVLWSDRAGLPLAAGFLLLVFPYLALQGVFEQSLVSQLGRYCCLAVLAVGLDLVWGYAGVLSLCQMLFFALGGYAMGMHLCMHGPLDGAGIPRALYVVSSEVGGMVLPWFWQPFSSLGVAMLMVVLVPGMFAFAFGWMAFRSRIKGVYFSIITQAAAVAMFLIFCRNDLQLCGTNGLTNFVTIFGFPLNDASTKIGLYFASVAALTGGFLFCRFLVNSRAGRILIAVRDSESRLRFAGYQPIYYKAFAFAVAAVLGAVGGMLYTPQNGIITPFKMNPEESIYIVAMVALGGRGTLTGAILGSLIFSFAYSWLSSMFADWWLIILGSLFVFVILMMPDGLVGAWRRLGVWLSQPNQPRQPQTTGGITP
jgi:urea transport system permease protein